MAVDTWGNWIEEADYSTYPKEKMCDYDRMAMWIREQEYEPKTSMENLIDMIFAHFDDTEQEHFVVFDDFILGCKQFVKASGGLIEFDYYC